ncbi:PilZ-like domain-containing protein [Citrifermentans bremense]|uniref:PilZ-like domain-containing protein n=1 Tax=Citrifermentans bremense TaxID=60035 RepID=UPI00040533A2|nr:PilZ-like domain-containing protein [Citrifermentans bremense]
MTEQLEQYQAHFQEGGRVRIGVPLKGGGAFSEWGIVASLDDDLLQLYLSRDSLPEQARLELGRTLDLALDGKQGPLACRGVLVADHAAEHRLVLRLVEDVVPYEPREYFRQDVYLPLIYRRTLSQVAEEVRLRWEHSRREIELAAQDPDPDEPEEVADAREEIRARLEKRKTAPPLAANLSGGGVRLNIAERFAEGELVELSIYLPQHSRMIEMIGEVVQVTALPDRVRFSTALRYRFIDEADRDRLIGYISTEQLHQMSQHGPRVLLPPPEGPSVWRRRLQVAFVLALLAGFLGCQARAILVAKQRGEKWEVQRVFDEGFMEFLRRQR